MNPKTLLMGTQISQSGMGFMKCGNMVIPFDNNYEEYMFELEAEFCKGE